jgi:hypothetical protein
VCTVAHTGNKRSDAEVLCPLAPPLHRRRTTPIFTTPPCRARRTSDYARGRCVHREGRHSVSYELVCPGAPSEMHSERSSLTKIRWVTDRLRLALLMYGGGGGATTMQCDGRARERPTPGAEQPHDEQEGVPLGVNFSRLVAARLCDVKLLSHPSQCCLCAAPAGLTSERGPQEHGQREPRTAVASPL